MKIDHFILLALAIIFSSCSDFPDRYENVIEGKKIRPFAIVMEPAEAAPGDTVDVSLHIYDTGKNFSVEWTLQLDYLDYSSTGDRNMEYTLDLDSMSLPSLHEGADSRLHFRFVVPDGELNPLRHPLVPRVQIPMNYLDEDAVDYFEYLGINVSSEGVKREALVRYFEQTDTLPEEAADLADEMFSLVNLQAKVRSGGFELDVEKRLTVRYSSRLEELERPGNVNKNPRLDSIGVIAVHKKDLENPDDIGRYESDTTWFSMNALNINETPGVIVDTFVIRNEFSYFLIADSTGAAQEYFSEDDGELTTYREQIFYQWFYTNLDDTNSDWEDLIEVAQGMPDSPVAWLKLPSNRSMHNFAIYVTVGDVRWEWPGRNSTGLAFLETRGYFRYK